MAYLLTSSYGKLSSHGFYLYHRNVPTRALQYMKFLNSKSQMRGNQLQRKYVCSSNTSAPLFPRMDSLSRPFLGKYFHTSCLRSYENNEKKPKDNGNEDANRRLWMKLFFLSCFVFLVSTSIAPPENSEGIQYISWSEFEHQMLAKGEVYRLLVRPDQGMVVVQLRAGSIVKGKANTRSRYFLKINDTRQFEDKLRAAETNLGIRPGDGVTVEYHRSNKLWGSLMALGILAFILYHLRKGFSGAVSSMFQMGKAKFTMIDPLMPGSGKGVKFSDVAGAHEAKTEVLEFVDFLKNPSKYQRLGAKVPRGALLLGPPGCGKTLLAKAVATEGHVPFLAMNGPEFIEMIGGLGAARVRDLFNEAKKYSPAIIYIDEIDAIGRQRSSGTMHDGSQEREQTLNQLLVEMDGLLTKSGVILLASTNRIDILDKALLRPGRFDRHIRMDLPTLDERRELFEHHLKRILLEKPVTYYARRLSSLTLGFSGADIANVCNEAALHAARIGKNAVDGNDLEYSVERVVAGTEKRSQVLDKDQKKVLAYHEAGHALMGWLLEHTDALLKVTIVPRTNSILGFAQYAPRDRKLYAKEELFEKMCMALGGRVSESLTFNRVTTGAKDDLERVTKMAYAQVRKFGFSDKIGHVSYPETDDEDGRRPYSKLLANTMDEEANKIIYEAYKRTEEILIENKEKLKLLAETLLQKETLNYEDVLTILGPPPFNKHCVDPAQFENEVQLWKDADK